MLLDASRTSAGLVRTVTHLICHGTPHPDHPETPWSTSPSKVPLGLGS